MKRFAQMLGAATLAAFFLATPASAEFGFKALDVTFTDSKGSPAMEAGSHPFAMVTTVDFNTTDAFNPPDFPVGEFPDGGLKDLVVELPEGFAGDPLSTPRCATVDFLVQNGGISGCAPSAAIGFIKACIGLGSGKCGESVSPVYNLEAPPGVAAKLGFWAGDLVPVALDINLSEEPPYKILASTRKTVQLVEVYSSELTVWGNPADPTHNADRGRCLRTETETCPAGVAIKPLITLPRRCAGPLVTVFKATSWWSGDPANPGPPVSAVGSAETHDDSDPPAPLGTGGCSKVGFAPDSSVQPSTDHAESPTGLDVSVDVDDEGLRNPTGTAHSDIKKVVLTLPEGMTLNPSAAEGLLTCTPAQLAAEKLSSGPGEGCPQASKVGTAEAESPALEGEIFKAQLFVAQQDDPATSAPGAENPFDSLIALYLVVKDPELGVLIKQAGKVEPDPVTGQLITTFDNLPQVPLSHVRTHLREGGRSPLISPSHCGTFTAQTEFTPWVDPGKTLPIPSDFQITRGVGGASCPPAGAPPFAPGFEAGTVNNSAASYSPFYLRLTRQDGEQDMTRFSSVFPPGLTGKLAGVDKCPQSLIDAARAKTGRQELAAPSCPSNSQIGRVVGGAGVGSQLTYVGGNAYLAGPYKGAPLSVATITPAVAGPFDAGTVVVQVGLDLDPRTTEVKVNGAASDPIPHILKGIVLKVRDLRVHVDRPDFTLNPTNCDPSQIKATLWGSFLDVFSPADDVPTSLEARFQAANCAELGFKPRLSFSLKGGTKRGGHPALQAVYRARPGDANLRRVSVLLPSSAFVENAHFRTICTRVQFAADACPKGSIYGKVRAFTPLLDEVLEGPVYLRSSNNLLPDAVFVLRGIVDAEVAVRIDSIRGRLRATVQSAPDVPVSKVIVNMSGAKKGLFVNSRDLCARPSRADVQLDAQSGRRLNTRPLMQPKGCPKGKRSKSQRG